MSDQWTELERLEVVGYGWSPLGLGYKVVSTSTDHPYSAEPLVRLRDVQAVIDAARASAVGTNGEAGREQKPVVTELVQK